MNEQKRHFGGEKDPLYDEAVQLVRIHKRVSVLMIQRHLKIGYNRSAYMLEAMVGTVITEFSPTGKLMPTEPDS